MERASRKIVSQYGDKRLIRLALALLIAAAAAWGANKKILGLFHDDGIYAVVAKSLAEGNGYRIISLPGAPPQTRYPFVYSYLLSWVWSFDGNFPHNILLLKSLNIAFLVALFFAGSAFYQRACADTSIGDIVFALILCTNPILFTLSDYVLSDLLAVLFTVIALILFVAGAKFAVFRHTWLPLALVSGFACLTRLAAVPLVVGGVAQSVFLRRFREGTLFVCTTLLVTAPWFLWVALAAAPPSGSLFEYYSTYNFTGTREATASWSLSRHWTVIVGNVRHLLGTLDLIFLSPLVPGFSAVVMLLLGVGMITSIRKEQIALWCFFLSTLALVLVWPFHPNRYMAPLVPLLLLFFFTGVKALQSRICRVSLMGRWAVITSWLAAAPILILIILNGVWLSSYLLIHDEQTTRSVYGSRVPYSWKGFEESFAWIRQNTPDDSVLGTAYDPMYFLYTGRKAIRPALHRPATYFYPYGAAQPDVGDVDEIKSQMESLRVEYLIIDPLDSFAEGKATLALFDQIVLSYGAKATLVFRSTDGKHRIYALAN